MRMCFYFRWLAPLLTLVIASSAARAGVPSAANSTVPTCLVACPLGDDTIRVVVRDIANNVLPGASVVLDFANCPDAFICTTPGMFPDPYTVNLPARTIRMFTDALGVAAFPLRVGGLCDPATVLVLANGTLLAERGLASPDQTGNGMVLFAILDTDYDVFLTKVGTNDPTADFDCDGDVDADDQNDHLFPHGSHSCDGYVDPAKRSSWGKVKSFYR